jgi:poly(hydroxyalkanoate) depolymerase family esterase
MSEGTRRPGGDGGSGSALDAALRSALRLTQNHHVIDATRLVQRALSGRGRSLPMDGLPRMMPALTSDDEDVTQSKRDPSRREAVADSAFPRPRHPLGMVVELLHRPEAPAPGFGALSPAVQRRREPLRAPEGAAYLARSHTGSTGSRDYRLYVPAAAAGRARGLVVMLHGCTQTPDDFAVGTGMNRFADEHGFVVAYPHQSTSANQSGCWNWFSPQDQARDLGEPSILAGLTRALVREYDIDAAQVFVAGLSAGGAMAAILVATYPDLFRAAGIHSGLAHGAASDLVSAFAAMRGTPVPPGMGQRKPPIPQSKAHTRTIVFHGTADPTVHPSNGEEIFASARGGLNGAAETEQHGRSPGGRAYRRKVVTDSRGRPQLEYWTIEGLGHAWSGGHPDGSYTDALGPDASREMVRFFLAGG